MENKEFFWQEIIIVAMAVVFTILNPSTLGLITMGILIGLMIERYLVPCLAGKIYEWRVRKYGA